MEQHIYTHTVIYKTKWMANHHSKCKVEYLKTLLNIHIYNNHLSSDKYNWKLLYFPLRESYDATWKRRDPWSLLSERNSKLNDHSQLKPPGQRQGECWTWLELSVDEKIPVVMQFSKIIDNGNSVLHYCQFKKCFSSCYIILI